MKIRTYDILAGSISLLGIVFILLSPIIWFIKTALICLILALVWREWRVFRVQSIVWRDGRIFVNENNVSYAAQMQPSSVITRYLCFLHVSALDVDKRWHIPVSHLEFSAQNFKQLRRLKQLAFNA